MKHSVQNFKIVSHVNIAINNNRINWPRKLMRVLPNYIAFFCIGLFGASAFASDADSELSMLMSWNRNHSAVVNIPLVYVEEVEKLSQNTLRIKTFGPEVVSPFEQIRPVSKGAFDIIFTHGLYHTGSTWIGASLDAIPVDPAWRHDSGVWDIIDQYYIKNHNLKILSIPAAKTGFRIFLHEDISPDNGLKGATIRSLHTQRKLLESMSATPVLLPPGDIYSAVEKGVVNGLIWTSVGAYGLKFHEVARQIVEPSFGGVSYLILMNYDSFVSLSHEQKLILLKAGRILEDRTIDRFDKLYQKERKLMLQEGATIVSLKSFNQKDANARFAEEVWQTSIKYTGQQAQELRDFVKEKRSKR